MSEKALTQRVMKYLNGLDQCEAEKRWGGPRGNAGQPDISACYRGLSLQIELKVGSNKPTLLQWQMIQRWRAAGALAIVARSVEEVESAIQEIDRMIEYLGQPMWTITDRR